MPGELGGFPFPAEGGQVQRSSGTHVQSSPLCVPEPGLARSLVIKPSLPLSVSGKARASAGTAAPGFLQGVLPWGAQPSLQPAPLLVEVTVTFPVTYRIAAHRRAMGLRNPRDPEAARLLLEARRSWTSTGT